MRALLTLAAVTALLAAACNDDNHRLDALEAATAELGRMKMQVSALQAQLNGITPVDVQPIVDELAALKAQVAALPPPVDLKPVMDRLDALEAKVGMGGAGVKVPHLVVDKTGEDLGQLVGGTDIVWSTKFKSEFIPITRHLVVYDQPNCAGNAFVYLVTGHVKLRMNTTAGTIYQVTGPAIAFQQESSLESNGNCSNQAMQRTASPIVDTKVANFIFTADQLRIELL